MTRRDFGLGSIIASGVLALGGCGGPTEEERATLDGGKIYPTYRYRVTVEVDTPEGLKTGSSVIEVKTSRSGDHSIPSPNMLSYKVRGQAVTVDLGQRGKLFALLDSNGYGVWAQGGLEMVVPPTPVEQATKMADEYGYRRARALALKGPQELPRHLASQRPPPKPSDPPAAYPTLVRFRDITNSKSIERVDPDNLAVTFGQGVKLRRITLERSYDPVTTGIEDNFKWWPQDIASFSMDREFKTAWSPTFAQTIGSGDFKKNYETQ